MYLLSLYFQNPATFGYSALEAGLATLPAAAAMIAVTPLITPLAVKLGAGRAVALGFAVATLGSGILIFVGASWTYVAFVVPLVLIAVGLGVANGPASSASTSSVDARDTGAASGISNMARYVGGALAVAAAATIYDSATNNHLQAGATPADALAAGLSRAAIFLTLTTSRRPRSGRRLDHPHDPRPAGGVAQCAAGSPIRAHRSALKSCSSSATAR
jgi:Na+/melibiose symporter-like transporter